MPLSDPYQLHDAFADAFTTGDVDALIDLYEPDAIHVTQAGDLLVGHEQLRAVFEAMLSGGVVLQGTQVNALVAGDLALTSTRYDNPDPAALAQPFATAEVLRRDANGDWRVVIDVPGFTS